MLLGVVLNLIADNDLRKAETTVKSYEEPTALVTTGAYCIFNTLHILLVSSEYF